MKLKLLLFFLFFSIYSFSQEKDLKFFKGVVSNYSNVIEGVTISNLTEKTVAISDETGHFSIYASERSILVFSSIGYESKEIILSKDDFSDSSFKVVLRNKADQLDEVVINSKINSVSLGIVSKDQKKYTVAERRLQTAGDFKWIHLLSILGGTLPFDPILNAINGRTKRLKKEILQEKKVLLMNKITESFQDSFFIEKLKIPKDYVNGFKYFILDDKHLIEAMNSKNKSLATFLMSELAVKYLKLLNEK
jgi:CarboxypepD_reg-like domain